MKKEKIKVYAELIDSPDRLAALIEDRRKRRRVMHICFAVIACSTLLITLLSLGSNESSASTLPAVTAIFFGAVLAFEFEWQLLHVLRYLADQKTKPIEEQPIQPPRD